MSCYETLIFLHYYIVPLESYCLLPPKPCIMFIGINTQKVASIRAEDEKANRGLMKTKFLHKTTKSLHLKKLLWVIKFRLFLHL